ncbi:hypothetical protein NBRC116587_15990 [Pseudoteredinibacter isoporae]
MNPNRPPGDACPTATKFDQKTDKQRFDHLSTKLQAKIYEKRLAIT